MFRDDTKIKDLSSFEHFTKIKKVEIGSFQGCRNLEKIRMPKGYTLQHTMFTDCVRLKEVIFPTDMRSSPPAYETFTNCISLKVLDFPETYTGIINSTTFRNVTAVIIFRARTVVKFERYADWRNYYKGSSIYVPDHLVERYKRTDGWNDVSECIKPLSEYQP